MKQIGLPHDDSRLDLREVIAHIIKTCNNNFAQLDKEEKEREMKEFKKLSYPFGEYHYHDRLANIESYLEETSKNKECHGITISSASQDITFSYWRYFSDSLPKIGEYIEVETEKNNTYKGNVASLTIEEFVSEGQVNKRILFLELKDANFRTRLMGRNLLRWVPKE